MNTVNRILCPVDMSPNAQNALRYALKIADKWKASIQVLHVIYPQAEGLDFPVMVAQATKNAMEVAQETMTTWIETTIAQVQINYEFENIPLIEESVELGSFGNTIVTFAKEEAPDLIIMGTKSKHNRLERLLGTVSGEVVRNPPCPVLLIPEGASFQPIHRMTYASNLLASDPYYIWKAVQLLKPFKPMVDCVHIQTKDKEQLSINKHDLSLFFTHTMPELQFKIYNLKDQEITIALDNFTETDRSDILMMYKPKESFLHRLFFVSETKKMALVSKIPLLVMV